MYVASTWGLTVSLQKIKGMGVNAEPSCTDVVPVHDQSMEMVKVFIS